MQSAYSLPFPILKPIVFFDLETTGIDITIDRIVEIAAIKIHPDGTNTRLYHLVDPTIPISTGASNVHGITDERVKDQPTFAAIAQDVFDFFSDCDLSGFNIRKFDLPLLCTELLRAGFPMLELDNIAIIDACSLYHLREPRNLSAALRFYTGQELDNAHQAMADVEATIHVLSGQYKKYSDLPTDAKGLNDYLFPPDSAIDFEGWFKRDDTGNIVYGRGKHAGQPVAKQLGYMEYMLNSNLWSMVTREFARKVLRELINY